MLVVALHVLPSRQLPFWFQEHIEPSYHWYTFRIGSARRDQGDYDRWWKFGPITVGWGRYAQRRFRYLDACWARHCRTSDDRLR